LWAAGRAEEHRQANHALPPDHGDLDHDLGIDDGDHREHRPSGKYTSWIGSPGP
jgi:hypothetical protein